MRIFISPLDWGLGHAARCIPIIRYLQEKEVDVIIGAEGSHLLFLKEHFPDVEFIDFPGYRISYSSIFPVGVKVLFQLPKIVSAIKKEHALLDEIIKTKNIDAVISDNRYGLWNTEIPSIIITHQLYIQARAGNSILNKAVQSYINHFDECWIPDYGGKENLSGALSHPIPEGINGKYIGPLSRFQLTMVSNPKSEKYDLLIILSGPEPQRTKLEEILLGQLKELPSIQTLLIQGLPGGKSKAIKLNNVEIIPHLSDNEFQDKLINSEIVLSRPGYSTLMDLDAIGWKKAISIPTPGQTEQEYLGSLMQEKGLALSFKQKGFSLKDALQKVKQIHSTQPIYGKENNTEIIDAWLKKID